MRSLVAKRLSSIQVSTWAFLIVICVVLIGLDGALTLHDHGAELQEARTQTSNLARSLADHAHSTLQLADTVLTAVREEVEAGGVAPDRRQALHAMMEARVAAIPLVRAVFFCDQAGECLAASTQLPKSGVNIEDREHFRRHRASPDRNPVIGIAVRYKVDGSWVMSLSRRVDHPDGSFAGVVVAVVPVEIFGEYYRTFDVGADGVIALIRTDGRLVAREPFSEAAAGMALPHVPTSEDFPPRAPTGSYEYTARVDGIDRIASYRQVAGYPLLVTVALAHDEVMAHWRQQAWSHLLNVGAVILLVILFGSRLSAQIRRREQADEAMARLAAEYRELTESLNDMVTKVGMDLKRTYVSPSCRHMLGYEPEELLGRHVLANIQPNDWPTVQRAYDAMIDPAGPGRAVYQCRGIRKDGSPLWIETSGQKRTLGEGFILTTRDISDRKQAEAALEALTREDALTGLVNRRGLDEALEREFYRAARNAAPLTLIMLDVDWFKAFNDANGHQAGDDCLKAIATVIAAAVCRPDDITARYGGEEFAVLLPDACAAAGAKIAEQIRAAVAELGIDQGSTPERRVTISAGVAATFPGRDATSPAELVKAADDALYAAKHAGRDRVCIAEPAFAVERAPILLPFN